MQIILSEWKRSWKSLLVWSAAFALLIMGGMGKYATGVGSPEQSIEELMGAMPESMQRLFGVGYFDLNSPVGYFAVLYMYLTLFLAVHAVFTAINAVGKEERDRTAEFLMTRPVSRSYVLACKLFISFVQIVVLFVVTIAISILALSQYSEQLNMNQLILLFAGIFGVQLAFMSLGIFIAAINGRYKVSSMAATSCILTMFVFSALGNLFEKAEFLRFFSFFGYFESRILLSHDYPNIFIALAAILSCVMIFLSFRFYGRRDLYFP